MSHRALDVLPSPRTSAPAPEARSESIRLRRALTYLGMTLVLPGSAQLAAGHRRTGRTALRIWAITWLLALLLGLGFLVWRGAAVALLTYGPTLRVLQVYLIALGLGWGLLLVDAWRISRPPDLARRHRVGFAALTLALAFAVVGGLVASASIVSAQHDLVRAVFAGGGDTVAKDGRYNILLMGGDAGKGRVGLRPDSITVASVDAETGRTVLLSLPRNLEDTPFPANSPLHAKFPHGFGCPDHSCMLNAVYTYGTEHRDLYPGVRDPGAQATKEAVEGATGLSINYWVLVDLKGFQALVDAVGGITLDVNKRVPIGGGSSAVQKYIEPGQNQHLDGYHALWFARSRHADSDYERMARQKCVMNAMLNQLDPMTVLTNFNALAKAGREIVATDIPPSTVNELAELAGRARERPIASVAFVPPLIQPGEPNFTKLRATAQAKIAAAEAADEVAAHPKPSSTAPPNAPTPTAQPDRTSESTPSPRASTTTQPNSSDTEDLAAVCRAR